MPSSAGEWGRSPMDRSVRDAAAAGWDDAGACVVGGREREGKTAAAVGDELRARMMRSLISRSVRKANRVIGWRMAANRP